MAQSQTGDFLRHGFGRKMLSQETSRAQMTTRLQELKDFIEITENALKDVRNERDRIVYDLNSHGQPMSPILRMPNEILTEIFSMIPSQQDRNASIMLVCKAWHSLSMNVPTLWSEIQIYLDDVCNLTKLWDYCMKCVQRSARADMNISLIADLADPTVSAYEEMQHKFWNSYVDALGEGGHMQDLKLAYLQGLELAKEWVDDNIRKWSLAPYRYSLLSVLAILRGPQDSCAARWRSLSLSYWDLNCEFVMEDVWHSLKVATPRLRTLGLHSMQVDLGSNGVTGLPNLEGLKTLELECGDIHRAFYTRLPSLMTLKCSRYDVSTMLQAQNTCANHLRELSVTGDNFSKMDVTPSASLPLLELLQLEGGHPYHFFSLVSMPSLQHLHINDHGYHEQDECPDVPTLNEVTGLMLDWKWPEASVERATSRLSKIIAQTPQLRCVRLQYHGCKANLDIILDFIRELLLQLKMNVEVLSEDDTPPLFPLPASWSKN